MESKPRSPRPGSSIIACCSAKKAAMKMPKRPPKTKIHRFRRFVPRWRVGDGGADAVVGARGSFGSTSPETNPEVVPETASAVSVTRADERRALGPRCRSEEVDWSMKKGQE